MAFDNVTFFEVNLPEQAFGGESKTEREQEYADSEGTVDESSESESGGGSKARLLLVALVLGGIAFAVRKFRSDGGEDDVEMEYEEPGVEVEA